MNLTRRVSHQGDLVSGLGQTLNLHFAVALDNRLITVPYVNFKRYPDGISGANGAEITGIFMPAELAILLRFGPLPVNLTAVG